MYPENPEGTQVIVSSMNMGYISDTASRQLQQFPFAFPNSRIDFPGIPDFPTRVIPPSLINFDQTYTHYRSLTFNHMNVINDLQQFCMLSDVCRFLVCFSRFQWHFMHYILPNNLWFQKMMSTQCNHVLWSYGIECECHNLT